MRPSYSPEELRALYRQPDARHLEAPDAPDPIGSSSPGEQVIGGAMNDHTALARNVGRRQAEKDWYSVLERGSLGRLIPFGSNIQVSLLAPVDVLYVVGPDERSTLLSVTLFIERNPIVFAAERTLFADVQWGNGSAFANAAMDFRMGQCFCLPASSLRVSARADSVTTPQTFMLGAFVSLLPLPMSRPPTLTSPRTTLEFVGSTAIILLGAFTRRVVALRSTLGSAMRVDFQSATGVTEYTVEVGVGQNMEQVDIGNRIVRLLVTNLGPIGFSFITVEELAFN